MLLSKRDFQKLSKKDKAALMNKKQAPKQQRPKTKTQKSRSNGQNGGRMTSVAAAYSTPMVGRAPIVKASRDSCNIQHREFIGNISGSVAFAIALSLSINPGLAATFPWLSVMAQAWEEYRFRSLRFVYKTRTGSTTVGSLMIAPDYDSADAAPSSEQIMSTYSQVIEDAVWKDITCVLKTSNENPLGRRHFIRTGPLAANLDIKTYDIANLFIATVDASGVVPWGKLWVEYDVDFYIPQLPPTGALAVVGGKISSGGTRTAANPLGTVPVIDAQALGFIVDALSVLTFLTSGTYLVSYFYSTGVSVSAITFTPGNGGALVVAEATVVNTAGTSGYKTAVFTMNVGSTLALAVTDGDASGNASRLYIAIGPALAYA